MALKSSKKLALGLGVASVAASAGSVAVQAGPALQTLNNMTNTAEFTINNTYGQSFSVDGQITVAVTPFVGATTAQIGNFNALTAQLDTGFVDSGDGISINLGAVSQVTARATIATFNSAVAILNMVTAAGGLGAISLSTTTGITTIGASISSTLYGPSNVKASSSFTNQLINDLSAF
jgi:hypothetical protein